MELKCPECNHMVAVNGIGPSNSPKLSWTLRNLFRFSCRLFKEAGNLHDLRYHIYKYGKGKADSEFLSDMYEAIRLRGTWYNRRYYKKMARVFYNAVVLGGSDSYSTAQLECLCNLNLNSRDIP